jgi:phosphoribosylformylglycinamidine synthase
LGFPGVEGARQGKIVDLVLAETDAGKAKTAVADMCEKLLANTVIENYHIDILG